MQPGEMILKSSCPYVSVHCPTYNLHNNCGIYIKFGTGIMTLEATLSLCYIIA